MEKKKIKLWKKILFLILILIAIYAVFVLRRYIIITNLINKSKNYVNKTNYVTESCSLANDTVTLTKSYNIDGDLLAVHRVYSNNTPDVRSLTIYKKGDEKLGIIQSGEDKVLLETVEVAVGFSTINEFDDIKFKLPMAFTSKIKTQECNGKECYLIEIEKDYKIYVEKETGIILRTMGMSYITNRKYTFDVVTDENIVKPDTSDCRVE